MDWNPERYLRYSDERALPFRHLVAAIDHLEPSTVVDLGCGPGGLTTTLRPALERLPDDEHEAFLGEYGGLLRAAYPARDGKTLFPFKRTFVVATSVSDKRRGSPSPSPLPLPLSGLNGL